MIKSICWRLWFISATLIFTCAYPCSCFADTSELSVAIENGHAWRSQLSGLESDQEDWFINESSQAVTSQMLSGRIGLGLSFETEVWMRGTVERLGELELTHHLKGRCIEPQRRDKGVPVSIF